MTRSYAPGPGLLLTLYLLLPVLASGLLSGQWFPYRLSGPQFLLCYAIHMLTGMAMLYGIRKERAMLYKLSRTFTAITLTFSLSRIMQGTVRHKPVLYLVLLTMIHILFLTVLPRLLKKKAQKR